MRRELTINFYGFWPRHSIGDFREYHPYLRDRYNFVLSDEPEFALCSVYPGGQPPPERAVKVFFTAENVQPDMQRYDWAMTFSHIDPPDPQHLRLPLYACYLRRFDGGLGRLIRQSGEVPGIDRPGFCNFVFSNRKCPQRNELFTQLSRYKRVDAPGKCMNNMPPMDEAGDRTGAAKWRFCRNYKFTIAYENASAPGYTTEKIVDAMAARSIPIYWGNPLVHLDFNPKSFLNRHDFDSDEAFIDRIIEVDRDDALYESIFREPYWHDNRLPPAVSDEVCLAFWERIFASVPARA